MQGSSRVLLDRPLLPPLRVELQGFPAAFWVVTKPKAGQSLGDICFEANILQFASMVRGGLDENTLHGIYVSRSMATSEAETLLD
jgi:hypothetical protein